MTESDRAIDGPRAREVTRRAALARLLCVALGAFGLALVMPGPELRRKSTRLTRGDGGFVRVGDLGVDSVATVFLEDAIGDASARTVLIRLPQGIARHAQGYVAYASACTHAGCPGALYRASAKQLICPRHRSVFDVVNDGRVVSGPADHPLPRVAIEVDADGFVCASGAS